MPDLEATGRTEMAFNLPVDSIRHIKYWVMILYVYGPFEQASSILELLTYIVKITVNQFSHSGDLSY